MSKYKLEKCPYCNKMYKSVGLHRHIKTHGVDKWTEYKNKKKDLKLDEERVLRKDGLFYCKECDYSSSKIRSVTSHWWRNHTDAGKKHIAFGLVKTGIKFIPSKPIWNKGKTKLTDSRLVKSAETLSKNIKSGKVKLYWKGKHLTDEMKQKISRKLSINNKGGRTKWYKVGDVSVQGTYEYMFAIKMNEQSIKWEKVKTHNHIFEYIWGNKKKSYAPDFYIPELNLYVEIKGFWWGNDEEKMRVIKEQHPDKNVIIIFGIDKLKDICKDIKNKLQQEPVWSW